MRLSFGEFCASTANDAAVPPRSVMKPRRLMGLTSVTENHLLEVEYDLRFGTMDRIAANGDADVRFGFPARCSVSTGFRVVLGSRPRMEF
jgi:hypothetical protein